MDISCTIAMFYDSHIRSIALNISRTSSLNYISNVETHILLAACDATQSRLDLEEFTETENRQSYEVENLKLLSKNSILNIPPRLCDSTLSWPYEIKKNGQVH